MEKTHPSACSSWLQPVPLSHLRGPVVLSLNAGVHSYARKIIIN